MMTNEEAFDWYRLLGLSTESVQFIERIRHSDPSRRVRSTTRNVSGRYPSRKMGVTIQFESHHLELAGVIEMEYDTTVLEFYDQPGAIKLTYPDRSGRNLGVLHTPDYFVMRSDSVGWEEWKQEEELVRLAEKSPHRYSRASNGKWHCPPGELYAEPFGLYYRVRSSAEISWVYQNNVALLADYMRADRLAVPAESASVVQSLVISNPGMPLAELLERAEKLCHDAD